MKILLISDFHGKIPKIKSYFDLILCAGDLCYSDELRDFEFKHWKELKENGKDFANLMTKKEYIRMFKKSINSADKILKWLNSKSGKVFLVIGNSDFGKKSVKEIKYIQAEPLEEKVKKYENITLLKKSSNIYKDFQILGFSGYRSFLAKFPINKKGEAEAKKFNLKWEKYLNLLFKKKLKNKFSIFLAHDVPRNVLDKINNKKSQINGKNIGDEYYSKMLKKYSPDLMVCGHMHENQGRKKFGKTLVVNSGYAHDNHYATIEINDKKIKSLKFY